VEILHECKYDSSDDAFQDDGPFERDMGAALDTLGQIRLYATAHITTQFLKDTWRVIIAGQLPEHQIYPRLHAKKVKNIAQLKEGADILTHKTITHEAAEIFPSKDFPNIRKFRHYRLALDDVGRDLYAFSSVKELVKAIHDATIGKHVVCNQERADYLTSNNVAHDDVFFGADILHRDISIGNVILNNGTGLLIDWDLCKIMNPESENEGHAIERMVSKHRYLDT